MSTTCKPMTLHVGPSDCLDGECDEYWTEDGDATEIQHCSHISEAQYCERHSVEHESGAVDPAEPWPCQHAATEAAS